MITAAPQGVFINVRVVPRSGHAGLAGTRDGALLVRLNAAPVEGAANAELIDIIARTLGVPKRSVTIASGDRGRSKRVHVSGISTDDAARRLPR